MMKMINDSIFVGGSIKETDNPPRPTGIVFKGVSRKRKDIDPIKNNTRPAPSIGVLKKGDKNNSLSTCNYG